MAEYIKKLMDTNIPNIDKDITLSLTFTVEEVKQLENAIFNSSSKRSYVSHKKDLKKFLLSYFEKQKTSIVKSKKDDEKTKSSNENKKDTKKIKGSNGGYKIIKVSKNYEFPTSIYKKDIPEEAAKSAMKAIIRKNNLDNNTIFTFSLIKGENLYKYTTRNGKLEFVK